MPSNMIHLLTGVAFTHSSNMVKDKSQFYLGCIAPDAVNVYSFAAKEVRVKAHLRSSDLDEWTQNAIDYYTDNISKLDNDLLLGYVLHTFCDMAWDKKYEQDFSNKLATLNISNDERFSARWNEFYYFDKTQFNQDWWLSEVKPALLQSHAEPINHIDVKQLNDFKNYVLNDYENTINSITPMFITSELVNDFIYYAVANFKNQL